MKDKWTHLDFVDSPADLIEAIVWEGIQRAVPEDLEEGDREVQIVAYASRLAFSLALVLKPQTLLYDDFESLLKEATEAAGLEYIAPA